MYNDPTGTGIRSARRLAPSSPALDVKSCKKPSTGCGNCHFTWHHRLARRPHAASDVLAVTAGCRLLRQKNRWTITTPSVEKPVYSSSVHVSTLSCRAAVTNGGLSHSNSASPCALWFLTPYPDPQTTEPLVDLSVCWDWKMGELSMRQEGDVRWQLALQPDRAGRIRSCAQRMVRDDFFLFTPYQSLHLPFQKSVTDHIFPFPPKQQHYSQSGCHSPR